MNSWIKTGIGTCVLCAGISALAAGLGPPPGPSEGKGGWIELIGPQGLTEWTRAPMHKNRSFRDRWLHVGSAFLDPVDPRRLATRPGTGVLVNGKTGRTWNLVTKRNFGDIEAHIEFLVAKSANSGVYFLGRYEVQILDSWGKQRVKYSDCGGIYQRWDPSRGKGREGFEGRAPRVNASQPPGRWQSFDVVFRAPRFDARGRKTANARFVKVVHNGVLVHENVECTGPTRAATFNDERPRGPLMLQGDHGPVAYRNIRVRPLSSAAGR
ncbi:MAG TPA: DUF1080 domain-containing protein [Planctomycetaceae bacterium]|nr:DUF1080 domain-containing protein [Planctomycetaceae bacterium]